MNKTAKTYEQAVEYLLDIPKFIGKNDFQDTRMFLNRLGNPDKNMKIIHVAGTNGKGSVCAYLRSLLTEMGYVVGSFVSPHLVEINERILLNQTQISNEEFLWGFHEINRNLKLMEEEAEAEGKKPYHPSFFEFLFFMAMVIFDKKKPDYVILETGLGGRLDATNSIEQPKVCVITRIGMDHTQYLGETISAIAGEKAGIIKHDVPVVFQADVAEAEKVIRKKAEEVQTETVFVSKNDYTLLKFNHKSIDFSYHSRYYDYIRLRLNTSALYQMENASLALRTAELLFTKEQLTEEVMRRAVLNTHWAARMEEIAPNVFLDGAHNEDGVRALLESVKMDDCSGKRFLIFGVVQDKAYDNMVKQIVDSGLFHSVSVVSIDNTRAVSKEELCVTFARLGNTQAVVYSHVGQAYEEVISKRNEDDRIYVAGSLYLAGELKGYLRSHEDD